MSLLTWIIAFAMLGSIGAVAGASFFLYFPEGIRRGLVPLLVSYATGTLLGAAFLGMLPAALKLAPGDKVMEMALGGMVGFFVLEKLVIWRHCHEEGCEIHGRPGILILIGDAFHNIIDGVMIAAAFLNSIELGITASLAIVAHEVPQELGDFVILLDSGYGRMKAFLLNGASSITTLLGAFLSYFWLAGTHVALPYILTISASSFLYIASADLIPGLHRQASPSIALRQILLILAGIGTISFLRFEK